MTGDEIVQELKSEQESRCDLYDIIIQDAYIDMNWAENLNDKVVGKRDYSLQEMADVGPDYEPVDDPEEGLEDEMDSNISSGISIWAGDNNNRNPDDSEADFDPNDIKSHWKKVRQLTEENQHLFGSILLDEKMRKSILKMNTEFWSWKREKQNRPANIRVVGLKCIGPMPLERRRLASEKNLCPFQTILDLDNSYLYMDTLRTNDSHTIKLSKRCVSCWVRHRLTAALVNQQVYASAEDEQSTCAKNHCFQTRWFGTRYCHHHVNEFCSNLNSMARHDLAQISSEFRGRQAYFMSTTSRRWTSSPEIQLTMSHAADIRVGHRQGTDLLILDMVL